MHFRLLQIPLLLLAYMFAGESNAQNLVKNPGFEQYNPTSAAIYLEDKLTNWYSYFSTPDYYSVAESGESVLLNYCGTLPRSGTGMVGGYQLGYFPSLNYYNREYIQGELTEPLQANRTYQVTLFVKPMLKSPVINWAVSNIGVAFTTRHYTGIGSSTAFLIPENPDIVHQGSPITELAGWTAISGCFRARGGET
jgi:hypothetical protein